MGSVRLALTPSDDALSLGAATAQCGGQRVALLLGSEAEGLTDEAFERADLRVRIPLRAEVDSLNVAAAGAVALHRFARLA